jgi:hypothetical protein
MFRLHMVRDTFAVATMATSIASAALWRGWRHGLDGAVRLIAALAILIAVLFVAWFSTEPGATLAFSQATVEFPRTFRVGVTATF